MNLSGRILSVLAALSFLTLSLVGGIFYSEQRYDSGLTLIETAADDVLNRLTPLRRQVAEIRYSVVQVQQWLTDISATRAMDGYDDGFKKADEFARMFHENVTAARAIAAMMAIEKLDFALQQIVDDFPGYYRIGKEMANAFISGGPEAGNTLMAAFDSRAEAIAEDIDQLHAIMDDIGFEEEQHLRQATTELQSLNQTLFRLAWGVALAAVALMSGCVWVIRRQVIAPLLHLHACLVELARENFDVTVRYQERKDEIGAMARGVEHFKEKGIENWQLRVEQDVVRSCADEERRRSLEEMADTIETEARAAVNTVAAKAETMNAHAHAMVGSAEQVSSDAHHVAALADQAMTNAQTVAAATEELSASIREIGTQIGHTSQVTREAVHKAETAGATIGVLSQAVGQIEEVVKLIETIAGQTNLLALNATIEAARAGEAGKGFAVVAGEVKNLATQTARSTEEISRRIQQIQGVTGSAVAAVQDVVGIIGVIDKVASTVAAAIEEQASVTSDIARNVAETAHAAQQVSSDITRVASESERVGAVAENVNTVSATICDDVSELTRTLVRVVRTSTQDADRRHTPRYAVSQSCTVQGLHASGPATLLDISEGGALMATEVSLALNEQGEVILPDGNGRFRFEVRYCEVDRLHVSFFFDEDSERRYVAFLAKMLQQRQAA